MLTWTRVTPVPASADVPQKSPVPAVPQPALYLAVLYRLPVTGNVMLIVGARVSTTHVYDVAVLVFEAASTARTWNVCEPSLRPVYAFGVVQAAKPPPSIWHSN